MKLNDWIAPENLFQDGKVDPKQLFTIADPFPHIELANFLREEKAVELLQALAQEQFHEKESDLFKFMQTDDLEGTAQSALAAFHAFLKSDAFIDYIEKVTGLSIKRGVVDLAGTLYQDTDFLLCHDDQLEGRTLAFLYYLSDCDEQDGGSLNLFASQNSKPTQIKKKIIPRFNSFACFAVSPISFHEVQELVVQKQRIALGGWFHAQP